MDEEQKQGGANEGKLGKLTKAMNMEEERKQGKEDENELTRATRTMQTLSKSVKNVFKMIYKAIAMAPVIFKLAIILIIAAAIGIIINALVEILDLFGTNNTSSVAASKAIRNEITISSVVGTEDGYYFKISKNIIDAYEQALEDAYEDGAYDIDIDSAIGDYHNDDDDDDDDDDDEREFDEERIGGWFRSEDKSQWEQYLVKMIRADIASSYPKLGEYDGESGTEDDQDNKKDKDDDYAAQGIVQIKRRKMDADGTLHNDPVLLTYIPYEPDFKQLIEDNNLDALDYFSFDESNGTLYYATYKEVIEDIDGTETTTYTVDENKQSYKKFVSMSSMPFNFLFSLLQVSEDPEWVMAVADLLLEKSEVVLMIQDQMSTRVSVESKAKVQKTTKQNQKITYDNWDTAHTSPYWANNGDKIIEYVFPYSGTETTKTVTTNTNTASIYIQTADTWCMNFKQDIDIGSMPIEETTSSSSNYDYGDAYSDEDFELLNYILQNSNISTRPDPRTVTATPSPVSTSGPTAAPTPTPSFTLIEEYLSEEEVVYYSENSSTTYKYEINVIDEKAINTDKFLGLWKNSTGTYEKGEENLYNPDGIEVTYLEPPDFVDTNIPSESIRRDSEEDIDTVIDLLSMNADTQMHAQLMMHFWNVFYEEIYDVDIDEILNIFDTRVFTSVGRTAPRGTIDLIKSQLTYWEGKGPMTADGMYYIAYPDPYYGASIPTIGPGLTNSVLTSYGITITVGDQIEASVIDEIWADKIENILESVKNRFGYLELEEYQYAALVIAYYNYPALMNMIENTYAVQSGGSIDRAASKVAFDSIFENKYKEELPYPPPSIIGDGNAAASMTATLVQAVNSKIYTDAWSKINSSNGTKSGGLTRRRYGEWILFQYGYDVVTGTY